jgi:hypothetical protein
MRRSGNFHPTMTSHPSVDGVELVFADFGLVRIGQGPFPVLVLLDGDVDLWIAEVAFGRPPVTGDTFHFMGAPWEVTDVVGSGCRAEPLPM